VRELPVSQGNEGHTGRVDILVVYPVQKFLIHVEVKIVKADGEGADLAKNAGYANALKAQYPDILNQKHMLLVTDAPYSEHKGFTVIIWRDVSRALRNLAAEQARLPENRLLGAMMLLFAGVVEQTLYNYPSLSGESRNSPLGIPVQQAASYLTKSLPWREMEDRTPMHNTEKEIEQLRQQSLQDGIQHYMEALGVIREFNDELFRRSEEVVKQRKRDIANALGHEMLSLNITRHEWNVVKNETGDPLGAWVACRITMPSPYLDCYFGVRWIDRIPKVVVMMATDTATRRDILKAKIRESGVSRIVDNVFKNEVAILEEINIQRFNDLEEKLNLLINDWVNVWKAIGGANNLT
jgi:hypothetical protein